MNRRPALLGVLLSCAIAVCVAALAWLYNGFHFGRPGHEDLVRATRALD